MLSVSAYDADRGGAAHRALGALRFPGVFSTPQDCERSAGVAIAHKDHIEAALEARDSDSPS